MSSTKNHPYHIVNPSPWPIVGSLGIFMLLSGVILMVRSITPLVFWAGLGITLFTLLGWWKDVANEAKTSEHTKEVRMGFRYGMAMFIASEAMFFVAFFWAYFHSALDPIDSMGDIWPPKHIKTLDAWDLPYFNTLLLLLSGTTVTWAHDAIAKGEVKEMMRLTALTILLGIIFLVVQGYEYHHAHFALKDGIYPSTFYLATGFHGFHVFVGVCFLSVAWLRAKKGHFKKGDHFGFDAAAWYWHFVDVVWLFLFMSIYWWGS